MPFNAHLISSREESEITSNRKRDSDNGGRFRSSVMSLACVIKMTDRMNDAVSIRIMRWTVCCWVPVWTKQNRTRERETDRQTDRDRDRERERVEKCFNVQSVMVNSCTSHTRRAFRCDQNG